MHFIEKKGLLFMKQGSKIGIVCCSNGLRPEQAETIKMLVQILEKSGLEVDLALIFMEMKTDRLELPGSVPGLL